MYFNYRMYETEVVKFGQVVKENFSLLDPRASEKYSNWVICILRSTKEDQQLRMQLLPKRGSINPFPSSLQQQTPKAAQTPSLLQVHANEPTVAQTLVSTTKQPICHLLTRCKRFQQHHAASAVPLRGQGTAPLVSPTMLKKLGEFSQGVSLANQNTTPL